MAINVDDMIMWSPGVTLEMIEKQVILKAFKHFKGHKTITSQALGIAIRTLDHKLEKYEMDDKKDADNEYTRRQERAEWLKRSRGTVGFESNPNFKQAVEEGVRRANAGVSVESVTHVTTKQAVPMPERAKVQTVLPQQTAQVHTRKAR